MKNNYTKQEVEEIVKAIIHQDSFGDVHYKASKLSSELGLDFSKNNNDLEDDLEMEIFKHPRKFDGHNFVPSY